MLHPIEAMGRFPARPRGVKWDDPKCSLCHSTQNVHNPSTNPAHTGTMEPGGALKARSKPNWDAYDSWGGMMPFNRDRIYKGSVEAAAFRKIFNPWTWWGGETEAEIELNDSVRSIIEQLELQPNDSIKRNNSGGKHDGRISFALQRRQAGRKGDS